jgi:hypothetical protein
MVSVLIRRFRGDLRAEGPLVRPAQGNALGGRENSSHLSAQRANRSPGERLARWAAHLRYVAIASPGRCPGLGESLPPWGSLPSAKGTETECTTFSNTGDFSPAQVRRIYWIRCATSRNRSFGGGSSYDPNLARTSYSSQYMRLSPLWVPQARIVRSIPNCANVRQAFLAAGTEIFLRRSLLEPGKTTFLATRRNSLPRPRERFSDDRLRARIPCCKGFRENLGKRGPK